MIISYLKVNGKTSDIELARREDNNYSQLEKDSIQPFEEAIESIPTGYAQMKETNRVLWSNGDYYEVDMITDKYNPQKKYDKANTKSFTLKLNKKYDEDIIKKLDLEKNIQAYIKELIRKDIQ